MKTQRSALLGYKKEKKIKEEKLINDHKFYWVVPYKDDKEYMAMSKRLFRGEIFIKQFYKTLIKTLDRANKLGARFKKGSKWIKRWVVKKFKKQYADNDEHGFVSQVNNMSDEEFQDFIKINDREDMQKLLSGELITTERLD